MGRAWSHGLTGYQGHGCRCMTCVDANRVTGRNLYRRRHGIPLDAPVAYRRGSTTLERVDPRLRADIEAMLWPEDV
jgi:hypothetical protein